jgi:DNA polymerase III alpha subunit
MIKARRTQPIHRKNRETQPIQQSFEHPKPSREPNYQLGYLPTTTVASCASADRDVPCQMVTLQGLIVDMRVHRDKRGDEYAFLTLADPTGQAFLVCFSDTFARTKYCLALDVSVSVTGAISTREGERTPTIVVSDIVALQAAVTLIVKGGQTSSGSLSDVCDSLDDSPGLHAEGC